MAIGKSTVFISMCLALVLISSPAKGAAIQQEGGAEDGSRTSSKPKEICENDSPCGWAVYTPFSRRVDFYMSNDRCKCSEEKTCIRTEDDVAISAYVYRCRVPANSNTNSPTKSS